MEKLEPLPNSEMESKGSEYSPFLTDQQLESLRLQPGALDRPFTPEELAFLDANGYVVLKKLIAPEICQALVGQIFEKAQKIFHLSRENESTWGCLPFHGCVDLWHLPALYTLRQHPAIYSVFCQLLRTHKLVPSIDRVGVKHPCRDKSATNKGLQLHTDVNFWHSDCAAPGFQGGICLEDCPTDGGGFFCIPGFHKREVIEKYMTDFHNGKFGRMEPPPPQKVFVEFADSEYSKKFVKEVPLEQGDMVIWSNMLPHNGGINCLPDHWRLHAYVRFLALDGPCVLPHEATRHRKYQREILESMRSGKRPEYYSTGNAAKARSPPTLEVAGHKRPELTELGKQLFGMQPWK